MTQAGMRVDLWKAKLAKGAELRLPLNSRDMEPLVYAGDVLVFTEAVLMDLRRRDLVLLYSQGNLRLRAVKSRLVEEGGEQFLLEALNLPDSAEKHGFEEILAKVEAIECRGKRVWQRGDAYWKARWRRYWKKLKPPPTEAARAEEAK